MEQNYFQSLRKFMQESSRYIFKCFIPTYIYSRLSHPLWKLQKDIRFEISLTSVSRAQREWPKSLTKKKNENKIYTWHNNTINAKGSFTVLYIYV